MFSNLASYLGYSSAPVERTPPPAVTAEVRVHDEEDDWVFIDSKEREGPAQPSEIDDEPGVTRVTLSISTYPANLPDSSKNLSRSVSLDISCPLQESWYLTPPPSFSCDGPVHMETSPLENMLIEHPSMSVYEHTSRRSSSQSPSASPCDEEPSLRPPSPSVLPRKDKLNKVPRNKMNTKFSKKLTAKRANEGESSVTEENSSEAKGPKMKNFAKSARRSVNSAQSQRVPNISRNEPFNEMISGSEKSESGTHAEAQVVPTRKLYSEVLASKPKPPPVQESTSEPDAETKEQEVPETMPSPAEGEAVVAESENGMSVEVNPDEGATEERGTAETDRRRTVQTIVDHQQRQNFLTRSAQKVEQRKMCDLMKRNPLIRTNKAREINFRNKRLRRADMMQRHSGVNNNRKC